VRAYEKAGFCRDRMVDTPDGPALLMVRDASPSWSRTLRPDSSGTECYTVNLPCGSIFVGQW